MNLAEFERRSEALRVAQGIFVLGSRVHVWGVTVRDEPTREPGNATFTVAPDESGGWRADEWYSEVGGTHTVGGVFAPSVDVALDWVWWRATREYFRRCVVPSEEQYDRTQLKIYEALANAMAGQLAADYRLRASPSWADVTTSSTQLDNAASIEAPAAVALRIARNPLTPEPALARMIEHPFFSVRWQLAGNPSTPPQTLAWLKANADFGTRWYLTARADTATDEVVAWAREDSALWSEILDRPDATAADLEWLDAVSAGSLRLAILDHHNVSPELITTFARESDSTLGLALLRSHRLDSELVRIVIQRAPQWHEYFLSHLGKQSLNVPAEMVVGMSASPVVQLRMLAAASSTIGPEVIASLASDPADSVRTIVARSPGAPESLLQMLAADARPWVREAAASNERLDSRTLVKLLCDSSPSVGKAAMKNPSTPAKELRKLLRRSSPEVADQIRSELRKRSGAL